ncbi:DUF4129 domain-containing protein [Jiangella anatolica]|uniref:Protein-glutamine gamma-glutamyltransferase-like C-terminal domain-containing protein n=1 Tax=Jiangella anatolica TaxID=2670374 RepID=A0A2W2C5A9_9ACTN|nr:DUF4129 domain-containing protein [Jiangella anatolica]PZF80906.1 hypothetical protein C1I92_23690 [Jiangella anatolica]
MIAASVPGDLDRDEARELAREELSNPAYERGRPILSRVLEWIFDQIERILDAATGSLSSQLGLAVVVLIAVGFAAFVILRAGPLARHASERAGAVLPDRPRSAAEYRAAADAAAARGDWTTAVVERFRAVVAGLEERGVLDPRPGRTADEAAAEATAALGTDGGGLRAGARLFDGVRYGGVAATADDDRRLRALDDAVAAARPRADRPADAGPVLAAPR